MASMILRHKLRHFALSMIVIAVISTLIFSSWVPRRQTIDEDATESSNLNEDFSTTVSSTSSTVSKVHLRKFNVSTTSDRHSGVLMNTDRNYTCSFLRRYINEKVTKYQNCTILFTYSKLCLNSTDIGRNPLPNFFFKRNNSGDTADDAYRNANVAFVHMPKAGGTSVSKVLMMIPGLNKTGRLNKIAVAHCQQFYQQALSFRKHKDQTLFYTKRTFGLHHFAFPGRPFAYTTWFREPIDRLISTFYYVRRTHCARTHEICKHYLLRSKNLTEYLQKTNGIHFQDMDNFYVRLLQFGDFPDVDENFEDSLGGTQLEDAKNIPEIEEKHYIVARQNLLTKMAFVGLSEDFKTSQDMLSYVFGIPLQKIAVHVNANPHQHNVTDFELRELRRRNIWDLKLYDEAKQIYYQQKKSYLDTNKTRSDPSTKF
ncbi:uncharacterized protein [Ptychodera flava]|uniref:uncharacterized protein n=1 Tax=Ptychodera flava TaxID=63121 RepID=UPI003969FB2C